MCGHVPRGTCTVRGDPQWERQKNNPWLFHFGCLRVITIMCDNIDIRMGKVEDAEAVAQHNMEMAGFDSVLKLRHGSMVVQEKKTTHFPLTHAQAMETESLVREGTLIHLLRPPTSHFRSSTSTRLWTGTRCACVDLSDPSLYRCMRSLLSLPRVLFLIGGRRLPGNPWRPQ